MPTKPTAKPAPERPPLLAFGAHPDDIEFGCGAVVAQETQAGRAAHLVVCTRGESASRGTPAVRGREAAKAARILGATLEFAVLGGDGELEPGSRQAIALARIIRRVRPSVVLAPSLAENQHPDHVTLGRIVRDAVRLARFGGMRKLGAHPAHAIGVLLYYAVTGDAEPPGEVPVLVDVSEPAVVAAWTAAMRAHVSQVRGRDYPGLQLARARVNGSRAGVAFAQALFPNDPLVFGSLGGLGRSARRF
jgi:LmbE family N-acetylglucosaminyl deacetylase